MSRKLRLAAIAIAVAVAPVPAVHAQNGLNTQATTESPTARLIRAHTPQIQAWIAGDCVGEVVPSVCYPTTSWRLVAATRDEPGFDWFAAGLGASGTLGVVLLAAGAGLAVSHQRRRRLAAPQWIRRAGTPVDNS